MDIYTVDFETHYSKTFSLSKMTTESYIRDPQFEVILVGIKKNNGPVKWVPKPLVSHILQAIDFSKAAILCHNTAFDGAILSWHYGVKPKLWLDTLSMARPIHNVTVGGSLKALATYYKLGVKGDEVVNALGKRYADFSREELQRYADYCVNDVELTYQLWLKLKKELPAHELLVIDQTLRMYTEPKIELDVPLLEKHLVEVRQRKEDVLRELADVVGMGEQFDPAALKSLLMSNAQFASLLRLLGVEPPMKVSPRTGKDSYAFSKTDKGLTDLLEHPDERVRAAVEARLGTKSTLEETRTEAFIGIADRGPLPIMLNYYGAHTGRFSGCLTADTVVSVFDPEQQVFTDKRIVDVLPDDLVWDGVEYVSHDGVQFSGYQEVVEWDGVRGTSDHVVFTEDGEISLAEAKARGCRITSAPSPN